VTNTGDEPFDFDLALHTYFNVGDVLRCSVSGLTGCTYIDKADDYQRKTQPEEPITFGAYTDRCYVDTPPSTVIRDEALGRSIHIDTKHANTTVVWNIGQENAQGTDDIAPGDWQRYLCVETANAQDNRITLAANSAHTTIATLSAK